MNDDNISELHFDDIFMLTARHPLDLGPMGYGTRIHSLLVHVHGLCIADVTSLVEGPVTAWPMTTYSQPRLDGSPYNSTYSRNVVNCVAKHD